LTLHVSDNSTLSLTPSLFHSSPRFGEAPRKKREKTRGERNKSIAHPAASRSRAKFLVFQRIWCCVLIFILSGGALPHFPRLDFPFFCFCFCFCFCPPKFFVSISWRVGESQIRETASIGFSQAEFADFSGILGTGGALWLCMPMFAVTPPDFIFPASVILCELSSSLFLLACNPCRRRHSGNRYLGDEMKSMDLVEQSVLRC
jgi:hypothetical protein